MRERQLNGEEITPDSFLVVGESNTKWREALSPNHYRGVFLSHLKRLGFQLQAFDDAGGQPRYSHHLYCLRKFTQTQLENAGINPNIIDHLLGRVPKAAMGRHYSRQDLEELREAYERALPRLLIMSRIEWENKTIEVEAWLRILGYKGDANTFLGRLYELLAKEIELLKSLMKEAKE